MQPANHWKVYGFTADTFILAGQQGNDPRIFRYDQVRTTQIFRKSGYCYVALNGELYNKSSGWGNTFFFPWDKAHCSDAQKFANALSTLVKSRCSCKMNCNQRIAFGVKHMKALLLGFVIALIFLLPLHAQTATKDPGNANAGATGPSTPAATQAPEEMTRKITDLVNAGKYAKRSS